MLIAAISSIIVFFFFGFNGDGPVGSDAASLTSVELGLRATKSICGILMICGMTYGAQSLIDGTTQTIQTGENNTDHQFASIGTSPAHVHDHITSTILGDPATEFWYSTIQTPAPYIALDGIPLSHSAPDARKVEAQASPDVPQDMINFAIMIVVVGIFVYLCFLGLHKISQLLFEGNRPHVQKQEAVGFHTLNVNPANPVNSVIPMPTDPSIKDSLDQIANAVKTISTKSEVRPESGNSGNEYRDTLETIRSEITSNNTTQWQATSRLSTRMENMEERIGGRFQESDSEVQRSFREIQRLIDTFNGRYTNDQKANNMRSREVRTRLQNLDSQIQALDGNIEQLRANDQNSRIASMNANIERLIRLIDTKDLKDKIQTLNETVEQLSNDKIGTLEAKIEKVNKSVKAINPNHNLQALEGMIQKVNDSVKAIDPTKKIQTFGGILEQVRNQTSKALTVDSPHFQALNERVMEIHNQVLGVPNAFIDLKYLTGELNQRVENLEREMQKACNKLGNYQTLESKIGDVERDIHNSMARRNDVLSATQEIREELQTIKDMSGEVQKIQKDISALSHTGGDVRSVKVQLKEMREDLHTIKDMPKEIEDLSKKIQGAQDLLRQKHDSIVSKLEANAHNLGERCNCQVALAKMQEELRADKNMTEKVQDLKKDIQEVKDEVRQKHDSIISKLEANRCICEGTLVTVQEEILKTNDMPGRVRDLSQEIDNVREELHQEHASAVSKLEADLRGLDSRLTSQETQADETKKAHEERLKRHDENLNAHEAGLSTLDSSLSQHGNSLSELRIDLDKIKDENERIPEDPRQEISRADPDPTAINDLIQRIADETIQLRMAANRDDLSAELKADIDDKLKEQDFQHWRDRVNTLADKVDKFKESFEKSGCGCNLVDLKDKVGKLEESVERSKCRCDAVNLAGDAGNLEESVKERMAENFAEWEKNIEDKLTTLRENLNSFEAARANNGSQLEKVDERLKGIEDQAQKTNDALFEGFSTIIKTNIGKDRQESRDQRLEVLARKFKQEGLAYGMSQLLEHIQLVNRRLTALNKTVHGDGSIKTDQSVLEQLDTFQTELKSLSNVYSLPGVLKTLEEYDQAGSQTLAFTQPDNQQTRAPIQSNAPTVPQSSPVSRPSSRRRLSDSDEVPLSWQEILQDPPREDSSVPYASQSNGPNTSTQAASVQQYSPVLQTATTTGWVNVGQQASPPYQLHGRDSTVNQPDVTSPTASEEQTIEPQDRPANIAGRKIKVPMSRRKSYQKQQQQQSPQPPTAGFTFPQQQRQQQQQLQQQQSQQQQPQQKPTEQNEQIQQPLTLEDIIDETQLADTATTEPTAQETTAQPPSPPPVGPEAQAALEAEATERAQSHRVSEDLFEDFFDIDKINDEISKALDEEDREKEEERGNHALSLPGHAQATDVPQNTQAETSQAAAQRSSENQGESSTQERGTVPKVQSNVAPPAETSKLAEASEEQKEAQEATKPKHSSSRSERSSLSQSRWADEPTNPAPKDERSGAAKDFGAQKKADGTAKQQNKPTTISQPAPKQTDNKPQGNTTGVPVKTSREQKKADETYWQSTLPPLRPLSPDFSYPGLKHADKVPQSNTMGIPIETSEEQKKADETVKQQNIPTTISQSAPKQTDNKPQDKMTGNPVKTSGEQKKADETVKQQKPSSVSQSAPKHTEKASQGKTTSSPATTSGEQGKEDETYWQSTLPRLRPLPPDFSYPGPKHADKVPQDKTASDLQKTSGEQKEACIAISKPSQPQGTSLGDSRWAQKEDDVRPEKEAASDRFIEDPSDREMRHQALVAAWETVKGKSMLESRWAVRPEEKEEPSEKEKTHDAAEKSLATPEKQNDKAPRDNTASTPVEELDDREIRHRAVVEVFENYKGTPLSASRWANKAEEKEEPSKKDKPREAVEEKPSGEKSLATPAKQKDKVPSDNTASTPIEGLDDREVRHRAVVEVFSNYKGTPLSASRWADKSDEQKESASTPKSEARGSAAAQAVEKAYSKAKEKEKVVDDNQPGTPDKWKAWALTGGAESSPAAQTVEKAYSKAKGKEYLVGKNLPGTPEKWNAWASTAGATSSPAETPAEREEKFQAVKEAWGTIKGSPLSSSRWATKEDEKEDTAPTPRSEAGRSPFRGPKWKYQVREVHLIQGFPKPKKEDLMKFGRIKGKEEDAAAEDNVASTSDEVLGDQNEHISEEQHDTVIEDGDDPFADVEEEVVFLDED